MSNKKLKDFEAFARIGTQTSILKRLNINYETGKEKRNPTRKVRYPLPTLVS